MKVTACICVLIIVAISLGTDITKPSPVVAQTSTVSAKESNSKNVSSDNHEENENQENSSQSAVQPKNNSETSSNSPQSGTDNKTENTNENESSSGGKYKDGIYEGEGKGFKSQIKVQVTVSSGEISDIKVIESGDDPEYFNRVQSLLNDIIKNQSADVNVVSGATFSSNGLIQAVNNALLNGGM